MKNLALLAISFLLIFSVMGCGTNEDERTTENMVNEENGDVDRQANEENSTNHTNQDQSQLEVADDAADRIVELEEIERATVIVTDENAYTAVVLQDGSNGEVTDQLKDKIADQIKAVDADIQNVFVSTNPDFVERMEDYGEKINKGEPVEGFFEEFSEAVQRVFPDAQQ